MKIFSDRRWHLRFSLSMVILVSGCLFLSSSAIAGGTPDPADQDSVRRTMYLTISSITGIPTGSVLLTAIGEADIVTLNTLYRRGRAREQHGIYGSAVAAYQDTLAYGRYLIEREPSLNKDKVYAMLPYLISAAYRLGITTQKSLNHDMHKLDTQLELYKETNDQINYLLTYIADIRNERGIQVSRTSYSVLYYAKGYNKMALAKTLINGNIWKNYTVYMPGDIVSLIRSAVSDFEMMLEFSNLSREALARLHGGRASSDSGEIGEAEVANYLASYIAYAREVDYEYRTLQLAYYTGSLDDIAATLKKRIIFSIYPILDYSNSKDVQDKLHSFGTIKSIESARTIPVELYNIVSSMFDMAQRY